MAFSGCSPLSRVPICLWSAVISPCFIHYHILPSTASNSGLNCQQVDAKGEKAGHPLRKHLSLGQKFMQNSKQTIFWHLQSVNDLTQLVFALPEPSTSSVSTQLRLKLTNHSRVQTRVGVKSFKSKLIVIAIFSHQRLRS